MDNIQLHRRYSLGILLRMVLAAIAIAAVMYWQKDFIVNVYFKNQLSHTGWIINGTIVALFSVGILRLITLLFRFTREEMALYRYMDNARQPDMDPLHKVPNRSIIHRRHRTMERLWKANTPINHSALAATLVASESTLISLPRFINNILILPGHKKYINNE